MNIPVRVSIAYLLSAWATFPLLLACASQTDATGPDAGDTDPMFPVLADASAAEADGMPDQPPRKRIPEEVETGAPGSLDPTFGDSGTVVAPVFYNDAGGAVHTWAFDATIAADGDILVVGYQNHWQQNNSRLLIARFDAGGQLVPDFGAGGVVVMSGEDFGLPGTGAAGRAIAIDGQDRIVVVGYAGSTREKIEGVPLTTDSHFLVARLSASGELDPTFGAWDSVAEQRLGYRTHKFGSDTDADTFVNFALGLTLQPDGKILSVGVADEVWGVRNDRRRLLQRSYGIVRYESDGDFDPEFGTAEDGKITYRYGGGAARAVEFDEHGHVLVLGNGRNQANHLYYSSAGVLRAQRELQYDDDLTLPLAMAPTGDGGYAFAGFARSGTYPNLDFDALLSDTVLTLGSGGIATQSGDRLRLSLGTYSRAYAIERQPDGKLLVAGEAGSWNSDHPVSARPAGDSQFFLFRAEGTSLDSGFGSGGVAEALSTDSRNHAARAIALQDDGSILVVGDGVATDPENRKRRAIVLARYLP